MDNENLYDDDQQPQEKSMEEMLREKLSRIKVGGSLKGTELDFLDKNASYGIKSITRVSQTKFKIIPTSVGSFKGIEDNAYLTIEPNKTISGKFFNIGNNNVYAFKGYKITQYNTPSMNISGTKTNSYIIHGNFAYYQKTTNTISAWNLRD